MERRHPIPTSCQNLTLINNSNSPTIGHRQRLRQSRPRAPAWRTETAPTGLGTASVECQASVSNVKTGTVMLSAPAPSSLTANLVGTGLEAIFMGILLPSS